MKGRRKQRFDKFLFWNKKPTHKTMSDTSFEDGLVQKECIFLWIPFCFGSVKVQFFFLHNSRKCSLFSSSSSACECFYSFCLSVVVIVITHSGHIKWGSCVCESNLFLCTHIFYCKLFLPFLFSSKRFFWFSNIPTVCLSLYTSKIIQASVLCVCESKLFAHICCSSPRESYVPNWKWWAISHGSCAVACKPNVLGSFFCLSQMRVFNPKTHMIQLALFLPQRSQQTNQKRSHISSSLGWSDSREKHLFV